MDGGDRNKAKEEEVKPRRLSDPSSADDRVNAFLGNPPPDSSLAGCKRHLENVTSRKIYIRRNFYLPSCSLSGASQVLRWSGGCC